MGISIFFAKLLGLYCLILAVLMLIRKQQFESVVKEFFASNAVLYFAGILNLLIGLAIAIAHPIWQWNWQGLITLLGYLGILKGIIRIGFPQYARKAEPKMMRGYWVIAIILLIIGIYLTYSGFKAHLT